MSFGDAGGAGGGGSAGGGVSGPFGGGLADIFNPIGGLTKGLLGFATQSSPAGPSIATGGKLDGSPFDSSGWNVLTGSGSITSDRKQAGEMGSYLPYVVVAVAGLVAWRAFKKT